MRKYLPFLLLIFGLLFGYMLTAFLKVGDKQQLEAELKVVKDELAKSEERVETLREMSEPKPPLDIRYIVGIISQINVENKSVNLSADLFEGKKVFQLLISERAQIEWEGGETDDFLNGISAERAVARFQDLQVGMKITVQTNENILETDTLTAQYVSIKK